MSVPASRMDDTRSSLLVRIKDNDGEAWLQIIRWIGPFLLRWCRLAKLQPADVEDVSQGILQSLWTHAASFRKDEPGRSFRGWVYTLTRNRIVDLQRQASPRGLPAMELPAAPDPSEGPELQRRAVSLVLEKIVADHADDPGFKSFYRTAVDGLTAPEVAAELGLKSWTVRHIIPQLKINTFRMIRNGNSLRVDINGTPANNAPIDSVRIGMTAGKVDGVVARFYGIK